MSTQTQAKEREVVSVRSASVRPMMGLDVLEPLPSWEIPYRLVDPFILVHEAIVPITRSGPSATPATRTAGSTTSGTCSPAKPPPATRPEPVARRSGHASLQDRC